MLLRKPFGILRYPKLSSLIDIHECVSSESGEHIERAHGPQLMQFYKVTPVDTPITQVDNE